MMMNEEQFLATMSLNSTHLLRHPSSTALGDRTNSNLHAESPVFVDFVRQK